MRLTDSRLKACVAVSLHGNIYMYSDIESVTLCDSARDNTAIWNGYDDFLTLEASTMATVAVNLGIRLNFTKGSKEDLASELWQELCMRADDRRQAKPLVKRDPLTGKKPRGRKKQDLSSRRYVILVPTTGPEHVKCENRKMLLDDCPCTTRQARKIWEFFVDEYLKTGLAHVSEGRMQDIVNDRAEELRTRQDPWRIFQYYRPELIQCQLIRLEK